MNYPISLHISLVFRKEDEVKKKKSTVISGFFSELMSYVTNLVDNPDSQFAQVCM